MPYKHQIAHKGNNMAVLKVKTQFKTGKFWPCGNDFASGLLFIPGYGWFMKPWYALYTLLCSYYCHYTPMTTRAYQFQWHWCWIDYLIMNSLFDGTATYTDIGGSVEDCSNSSALAMELLQFCTEPSICCTTSQHPRMETEHGIFVNYIYIYILFSRHYFLVNADNCHWSLCIITQSMRGISWWNITTGILG